MAQAGSIASAAGLTRRFLLCALLVSGVAQNLAAQQGGAAITPALAKRLFDRLAPLREADGCRLSRLDTGRFEITIGLQGAAGGAHEVYVSTAPPADDGDHLAGDWTVRHGGAVSSQCSVTLGRMRQILASTQGPASAPWRADRWTSVRQNYTVLALCFVALILSTAHILWREVSRGALPRRVIAALCGLWGVALALRLWSSPRTFLHEYYHVAGTLASHLRGQAGPVYGDSGPAIYQMVAWASGRVDDPQVIFLTNAFLAALAIPAVACLDYLIAGRWSRAICAAVFLCVLPQHLRFSASEVLFIPAVTFGFWALALALLYMRTHLLGDALAAALAFALAIQARPEMHFLPVVFIALAARTPGRALAAFWKWSTLAAAALLGLLLVPRFFEIAQILQGDHVPTHTAPTLHRLWHSMVLFQPEVTPPLYWGALIAGAVWALVRQPAVLVWTVALCAGWCAFSLSSGDNPPYNVRSQLLPNSFTVLIAAGIAPLWSALWRAESVWRLRLGATLLAAAALAIWSGSRDFVGAIGDQQAEWSFLERSVPELPPQGRLLANTELGNTLDAFPELLLQRHGKIYEMIDLAQAQVAEVAWPEPGDDLFYYQGMFCHCAPHDAAPPAPLTPPCEAVHRRYHLSPVEVTEIDLPGFSALRYAPPPYRIGFYRLSARKRGG